MGRVHGELQIHIQRTRMMLRLLCLALCLALSSAAEPQLFENDDVSLMQDEGRFLYFNSSSTATSLTLLGAVILLGVIGYLVYVGGLLGTSSSYNRNDYYNPEQYQDPAYVGYA